MKDIVIPGQRITRELVVFAGCFAAALGVNVYAIVRFGTEWKELITTLHITLGIACLIYIVLALIRGIAFGCRRLFGREAA